MDLLNTYEEYKNYKNQYVVFIEELFNSNLKAYSREIVLEKLEEAFKTFEMFNSRTDSMKVEEKDEENLRDLRYLIFDSLLLSSDLLKFYKYNEVERFKMRTINYINKVRREEMFSSSMNNSSCRVK